MGKFAQMWSKVDPEEEKQKFAAKLGITTKQLSMAPGSALPEEAQLAHIEKMAQDMTWLEKFSLPFKKAFKDAMSYETKRQIGVMTEFFDGLSRLGHSKAKLYIRQEGMDDHLVEYDDCGQKSRMNSTIAIDGKVNQFKAKVALEALKKKGCITLTVYLKKADMKDHYIELNDNGQKIPFLEKVKEMQA
jgi:hypothetical protein